MIDEYYTFKVFGYNTDRLSRGSHKRVVAMCDECGIYRDVGYRDYRDLCHSCGMKGVLIGENHPMFGKHHTKESREKISDNSPDNSGNKNPMWKGGLDTIVCESCGETFRAFPSRKQRFCSTPCSGEWMSEVFSGENSPNWTGGYDKSRPYLTPVHACKHINERFPGSDGHHVLKDLVVFVPSELHKHIKHDITTGENMGEINALAIQFINGGLET